jgi:hypothetical protein
VSRVRFRVIVQKTDGDLVIDDLEEPIALQLLCNYKLQGFVAHKVSYLHEGT